uniref:Uncharacterized protein n=1 Tax=Drosophila-associated filamentous virus TaxID=2743186 RepID=A0A6M9U076_9VIRU|nr:putative protein 19 [Drosophila-associated filamentous virus]
MSRPVDLDTIKQDVAQIYKVNANILKEFQDILTSLEDNKLNKVWNEKNDKLNNVHLKKLISSRKSNLQNTNDASIALEKNTTKLKAVHSKINDLNKLSETYDKLHLFIKTILNNLQDTVDTYHNKDEYIQKIINGIVTVEDLVNFRDALAKTLSDLEQMKKFTKTELSTDVKTELETKLKDVKIEDFKKFCDTLTTTDLINKQNAKQIVKEKSTQCNSELNIVKQTMTSLNNVSKRINTIVLKL